jgi:aminoacrylate hydrolase
MTDDLLAVMDHLKIEKAHLVGHSTGGAIGQTLAARHPERLISLVIYASWPKADPFFRRVFEARRALLTASGAAAYVRSTTVFLYPDWWINENIGLLEEREPFPFKVRLSHKYRRRSAAAASVVRLRLKGDTKRPVLSIR